MSLTKPSRYQSEASYINDLEKWIEILEYAATQNSAVVAALEPFLPAYEDWMDSHADNVALSFYRPATFGDLRKAHAAVSKALPKSEEPIK